MGQNWVFPFKLAVSVRCLTGCDLVLIPAGMPRKPGMTRDDLFKVRPEMQGAGLGAEFSGKSISMTGATERKHTRRQYGLKENMEGTSRYVDDVDHVECVYVYVIFKDSRR